jgi:Tol biopolymer transport system component
MRRIVFALTCAISSSIAAQSAPSQRSGTDSITIVAHEGTAVGFDLTPDGRTIVFDLLGQLWSLPVEGGEAVPLTHAVRDVAEDSDPNVSPDGRWIVFRSDRPRGRGLWLLSIADGTLRLLTDSAYFSSNDHLSPTWSPDSRRVAYVARFQLHVIDVGTRRDSTLRPEGLPRFVQSVSWTSYPGRLLVTAGNRFPGWLWELDIDSNRVVALDTTTRNIQAPRYSPDRSQIAYFADADSGRGVQLWTRSMPGGAPRLIAASHEWAPFRIEARARWSPDGKWLYYSRDGNLWRVGMDGTPSTIPFTASLTFPRMNAPTPRVHLPVPGSTTVARGFAGLAISPDGRRYAMLALGKLWLAQIGERPRVVVAVPSTAAGLSWSPDGAKVVWSAGRGGAEDLFVTTLASGVTVRLTTLPGSEASAAWSPDGKWIAFAHWAKPASTTPPWQWDSTGSRVRVVVAGRTSPAVLADTRDLGPYDPTNAGGSLWSGGDLPLNWDAASSAVLTLAYPGWVAATGDSMRGNWLALDGATRPYGRALFRPSYLHLGRDSSITYVEGVQIWRRAANGGPHRLSGAAALYPSVADDGSVLYAGARGLELLRPDGSTRNLGWPLPLRVAPAAALVVRNVRVFDGTGAPVTTLRDLLVVDGRIRRIEPAGSLSAPRGVRELDGGRRVVIPGLIDAHAHVVDPSVLPASLYFGVTTVRDMGSELATVAAQRDAILAGAVPGARVLLGGPWVDPAPVIGGWSSGSEWTPKDSADMLRGLDVLQAFGATHVKMRVPNSFASGAMLVRLARARGMTISGHCGNPLPLVLAGVSAQEHLDGQCSRHAPTAAEDRALLYRATGVVGVSVIYLYRAYAEAAHDTNSGHRSEIDAFLTPRLRQGRFRMPRSAAGASRLPEDPQGIDVRRGTQWFHRMGLPIALGVDGPDLPGGEHDELEELVGAGLSPSEALVAATSAAARLLGIDGDVGRVAVGQVADLVLVDGDPTADIRNTRQIWRVIENGRVIDRAALRRWAADGR